MKKIFLILTLFVSSLLFAGCQAKTSTAVPQTNVNNERTGTLQTKIGDEYILNTTEGLVNVNSTKLNLDNYLKKKVKITGQFSGSTLYADNVSEVK